MLSERLRTLLAERKLSIQEYAEMCDLPVETIRNIYYGKSNDPKLSTAVKMASALNLSVNCLMGQCMHTKEERAILQCYRNSGRHGKAIIELVAKYEAGAMKAEREAKERHKIPCIVPHGDLRKGILYDTCETVEAETSIIDAYVAIQMTNNDFAPVFCKHDILLFENRFPRHGEIAAFYKTDRAYIRKYIEEDNQYRLKCLHGQGDDIVLKRMDEIDYIGTYIGLLRD